MKAKVFWLKGTCCYFLKVAVVYVVWILDEEDNWEPETGGVLSGRRQGPSGKDTCVCSPESSCWLCGADFNQQWNVLISSHQSETAPFNNPTNRPG